MDSQEWIAHWEGVRRGTLATIDLFQEDELGYAPVAGGYTIGEIALHIAHEEEIEIHYGLARIVADMPEPYPVARFPSKGSIVDHLAGVHARSIDALRDLSPAALEGELELAWGERLRPVDVILHVIEHETHHRGELSLALGILGRRGYDA